MNSPYEGPLLEDAPAWCLAHFEPEGILRSFSVPFLLIVSQRCEDICPRVMLIIIPSLGIEPQQVIYFGLYIDANSLLLFSI